MRPRLFHVPLVFFTPFVLALACTGTVEAPSGPPSTYPVVSPPDLAGRVEIRRTTYGVPHILGETLEAGAFGLAWVMMEDYREAVPLQLLAANGRRATVDGVAAVPGSYAGMMAHDFAVEIFSALPDDVKGMLEGFAQGVNYFIETHRAELPEWVQPGFTAQDVAAKDLRVWDEGAARGLLAARRGRGEVPEETPDPNDGSNAWAFGPERTRSGYSILVRNPHLSYTSGYYEAHMTVPGVLNYYGDFRMGGPFGIIGGFNDRLGWSTTNNYADPDQIYALLKEPTDPNAYIFDGDPAPIETRTVSVEFLEGERLQTASRDFRFTPLGPVLLETADTAFVLKTPTLRQYRLGEQWLRMMQAQNLEEWKAAMRIQAKYSSNFTYGDADGNIFYVWNASVPLLPHPPSGGQPVVAKGWDDVWTELQPWDELPQLLNPRGGYLQNANDPPYFTNLNEPLQPEAFPANFPAPRLRFRSQYSLELVHTDQTLSLEEVVELKHSMKMMLADRVKSDLVDLVRSNSPAGEIAEAIELLARWDNQTARESRGATLFEQWAGRYFSLARNGAIYREPWSIQEPMETPRGLGDEAAAVEAFRWAVRETESRFGSWDVSWGDAHRIRAGDLDLPVGGCPSNLGCFRVIGYGEDDDGKFRARTGDAWVLAVEFGEIPRAYSVLLYGNSNQEDSPYFYNQAELFANNRMKRVAYAESDISAMLVRSYRPGEEGMR